MSKEIQPIFILPEGVTRTTGKTAQRNNIMAAKLVAETVRTTLGPKGMDKMIVDSFGDITVTNDGVTILEEMKIEHPAAKMVVEIAKTQEAEVGDGTTTAVILAGELLQQAEQLLDKNVHSTVITKGFRLAGDACIEKLKELAQPVTEKDDALLRKIAMTAMTGKGAENAKETLADIAVKAVKKVIENFDGSILFDKNNIKIEKKSGNSVEDTEFVEGVVLEKEAVHPGMPQLIHNAKVALLDCAVEIKNTEIDAKIQITDPAQMQAFLDQEERMLLKMVDIIQASGANVVFCQKGIDDVAQHFLAKRGIYAARRLKQSDMEALARATGATIVSNLQDLSETDLGKAGVVKEVKFGDDEMTYVTECKNPKSVTIVVRGGTPHITDEAKRALTDAIGDVAAALKSSSVVAGAGAVETELAKHLRKYAESLGGREQLAVEAFANAMEIVPRTLAENAGLDPIDVLTSLKAAHDKKQIWAGIDVFSGKIMDAWKQGVIEPLKIKTQAITSASEVAQMILRIDDVIASGKDRTPAPKMPEMGDY
ncbi:TCP-1/cpn60 chaperonin family protein [Candidatus Woesearchaeota archaeon]|nr:TCP-1/cpn60 chaperonin family protein [Candidatus Woesearchaeota archaeon]